jgi:hypothetical protein
MAMVLAQWSQYHLAVAGGSFRQIPKEPTRYREVVLTSSRDTFSYAI